MKREAWVFISETFDAAHHLPDYKGKCAAVHGHTYKVHVGLYGQVHEKTGMVIDMTSLTKTVRRLLKRFDHADLNTLLANPTAENIAWYILKRVKRVYNCGEVTRFSVTVYETPTSSVTVNDNL